MELKGYTTEELRAEIKRRYELEKEAKKREPRCRNCKYLMRHPQVSTMYLCEVRTWGKKYKRNYCVKLCNKACDKFELKDK